MVVSQMRTHVKHGKQASQNQEDARQLVQGQGLILIHLLSELINLLRLTLLNLFEEIVNPIRLLLEGNVDEL
jgi:hypothetical protein